ncbi:efflux RND transporter permease subunit [Luteolibacter algae]|uniref:Efflux RND transporter permease subunit n=1 Tax=Luteolibacter algae TaxID=454151 RepID=A0ABW5D7T1_9BACT
MKNFSFFFIDRPRFATVISLLIIFIGAISYFSLPVAQFPEVAPPTVTVTTAYPGASPDTIAKTLAAPIEQEVNGVEDMLYMTSQSTADGAYSLTVTFKLGTDLDKAQVLVQNRVALAESRLPESVRRIGVTVQKASPDLLLVVQMFSKDGTFDMGYISNYALLQVRERLRRIDGVGEVRLFGGREYSMRVWMDPERMDFYKLSATEVVAALRAQNVQVAAGTIGQQPLDKKVPFQVNVTALGRLSEKSQFEKVVVKTSDDGRIVRLSDVARVELGSLDYNVNAYLGDTRTLALPVFQRPGSNALEISTAIRTAMKEMEADFPEGLDYDIVYDPTQFIDKSIEAVLHTLFEAVLLVVLVMIIFLQSWRAAIIPVLAIPVSLIGTFAVMQVFGFSVNNLTLFGLVLAIGIVVDDAIVVVENIERNLEKGLAPREAARQSMAEVSGAIFATSLVLLAVFVPTAFLSGISGQFYRQFALTIAASTMISALISLTLSPALGVLLLRPKHDKPDILSRMLNFLFGWFFNIFNRLFDRANNVYTSLVRRSVRMGVIMILLYLILLGVAGLGFKSVPGGFIPSQDQGYSIVAVQLPTGASLDRTDEVAREVIDLILNVEGVQDTAAFAGFSGATFSNSTNSMVVFTILKPFEERKSSTEINKLITAELHKVDALGIVIPPPTVRGLGNGGGFKMEIQDRAGLGYGELENATWGLAFAASAEKEVAQAFTPFTSSGPQFYADIDREKALMLGVPLENLFQTLEIYLGSSFVNELNLYGRTYRVTAQADAPFRDDLDDIAKLKTRNTSGGMVPLGSLIEMRQTTGPDRVVRHNLYPSAELIGTPTPGISSGQAIAKMEELAAKILPPGISFEWIDLAYQETTASTSATMVFLIAILFVFLLLSAQYESWGLPLAVVLTVPLCLAGAIWGIYIRGMDNNILTQIGLVVLVALASKNAILIVEFAKQLEEEGKDRFEAAVEAASLRLRPIIMTSLAFILGVVPLVIATGPGAEMRQSLGTVVFFGMIAVTLFGVMFAPLFYVLVRRGAKKPASH